jgi:glycosyltransferase involved in cell wall biosynthesis
MSLRIAQLMASGPVAGGLEKHFADLCTGLAADNQVLAIADPVQAGAMSGAVDFAPFDFSGSRRNPFTLMRIHRLLKNFRPDVIHAHANKAAAIVASLRYFSSARRVATVHGFKNNNSVFRHFDSVICVSGGVRDRVAMPQTVVIPNGIHPALRRQRDDAYLTREFGIIRHRPVVVTAGRLAPVKGYAGLIEAWQGIEADLVIAGEGPERANLTELVKQLGLLHSVHLVGFRTDVPELMANADMVVISSEREGFPYAMVEALHMEHVIVSTQFPGAADHLPPQFLVPYGDTAALRERIQATLANLEAAKVAYRPIWQRAQTDLTVSQMVKRTGQVYSEVLSRAA